MTSIGVVSVISGLSIVTKQIAILSIKEKQLQLTENILTTESNNQICNAYIEGETLSIASIFHGTYKEPEGYLKFYSVKEDGSFEERRKYFSEYGWKDVSVDFYPQGRATWLKVDYTNDSSYFVKVDETGKILSRIPIKEAIGAAHFAILDSSQIISYNDSIVIAKEKPQNEE